MVSCVRQLNRPHVEYKNLKYKQEGLKKKKNLLRSLKSYKLFLHLPLEPCILLLI